VNVVAFAAAVLSLFGKSASKSIRHNVCEINMLTSSTSVV